MTKNAAVYFQKQFDAIVQKLPIPQQTTHKEALECFKTQGLPTSSDEAWKYTRLSTLMNEDFLSPHDINTVTKATIAPYHIDNLACYSLVFINGVMHSSLSESDTLDIVHEAKPLTYDAVSTLNAAFATNSITLHIPENTRLDRPIHIISLASATTSIHPQIALHMHKNSSATLIETHAGLDDTSYWTNPTTQIKLAEHATLHHLKIQQDSTKAYHTATSHCEMRDHSIYHNFSLYTGALLARNTLHTDIKGQHAACHLYGAYLAREKQHIDNYLPIIHHAPHSYSNQSYKGVLDDRATGIFYGKISVPPGAIKTDAHQLNHNLLLAEHAVAYSRPELEIETDDVQCSHGSAIGAIDLDALFYLQSRGIPEAEARRLVVEGFVADVFDSVQNTAMKTHLIQHVQAWLAKEGAI